jgi:hypothetical protein
MATGSWWVIAYTQEAGPITYQYFQGTQAQAQAQANLAVEQLGGTNLSGPYATKAAAQAAVKAGKVNKGTSVGQNPNPGTTTGINLGNAIPGLTDIANFFDRLGEANTWIRVGEVILGLVLIAAGIAKITHAVPIATDVAKAAGTAALL